RLRRVKRPRIYGSDVKCRTALRRYISSAEDLLDQVAGVRKRVAAAAARPMWAYGIEEEWTKDFRRWFRTAQRGVAPYLQEQCEDVLPTLAYGLPPDDGKPRHAIGLDNGEPWLRHAVEELQGLQAALGVRRDVATALPAPARFQELHSSGLVAEKVI